jgi:hypothetical protein
MWRVQHFEKYLIFYQPIAEGVEIEGASFTPLKTIPACYAANCWARALPGRPLGTEAQSFDLQTLRFFSQERP